MVGPSFNQTRRTAVITISHCKPIDIDRIRLLLPTSCCYWADKNCTDLCIVWLYNPFLVKNYNIFLMISYWKSPNNTSNIVQLSKLIVLKIHYFHLHRQVLNQLQIFLDILIFFGFEKFEKHCLILCTKMLKTELNVLSNLRF